MIASARSKVTKSNFFGSKVTFCGDLYDPHDIDPVYTVQPRIDFDWLRFRMVNRRPSWTTHRGF